MNVDADAVPRWLLNCVCDYFMFSSCSYVGWILTKKGGNCLEFLM